MGLIPRQDEMRETEAGQRDINRITLNGWTISQLRLSEKIHLARYQHCSKEVDECVRRSEACGIPRAIWTGISCTASEGILHVNGEQFNGIAVSEYFSACDRVFPYIATCGAELAELVDTCDDCLERFWMQEIASIALEAAIETMRSALLACFPRIQRCPINPGAAKPDFFPIGNLSPLFRLFPAEAREWLSVKLTEHSSMIPAKSAAGFFFEGGKAYNECVWCGRTKCEGRSSHCRQTAR